MSVLLAFFLARILVLAREMVIFGNGRHKYLEKAEIVQGNWKLDSHDPISEMEYPIGMKYKIKLVN